MAAINLTFRTATPDDAPKIQQLVEAAFRSEDSRANWTADMELHRSFRYDISEAIKAIARPEGVVLMASDDSGAFVGSVEVYNRAGLGRIAMLAVDQTVQRGGLGRRMVAQAEAYAQQTWGLRRMGLNAVSTREELIKWYERCGYEKTGEVTTFPIPGTDLTFVELEKDLVPAPAAAGAE